MKKIYILFILSLCGPFAFGQQSALLEKYRSLAVDYSHDLKAAEKNLAASIELEKSARADLKPKLSGDASFQYTGNPLELNLSTRNTGPRHQVRSFSHPTATHIYRRTSA